MHTLFADGACRGNPGPAGAGWVIFGADGKEVASGSQNLGRGTNNTAEYDALILGLQAAKKRRVNALEVRMDSLLVVSQLRGEWKVKQPQLRLRWEQAARLAGDFASVSFSHVPRAQNARADRLASEGVDKL